MAEINSDIPLRGGSCWVVGHDVVKELEGREPIGTSVRTWKWFPTLQEEKPKTVQTKVYRWAAEFGSAAGRGDAGCEGGRCEMMVEIGEFGGSKVVWVWDRGRAGRRTEGGFVAIGDA